jgi:uncharacterized phage protein (TIGR01671 family)
MREIKFRFWQKDTKSFIENIELGLEYEESIFTNNITGKPRGIFQQFTGVKDKRGKEIYEGDIVEIKDDNIAIALGHSKEYDKGAITWWNEGFAVSQTGIGSTRLSDYVSCDCCNQRIKIIGNIYGSRT